MSCCAVGPCGREKEPAPGPGLVLRARDRYTCYLCYVLPRLFPLQPRTQLDLQKHDRPHLLAAPPRPTEDQHAYNDRVD